MVIVHIMHTYLIIFYIQLIHPNTIYGILYIYIYIPRKPKTQNVLDIMGKNRNDHVFW